MTVIDYNLDWRISDRRPTSAGQGLTDSVTLRLHGSLIPSG
jgi:hypothetical protein